VLIVTINISRLANLNNSWGAAAMSSGAVTSLGGFIACRSLLGVFEAAFGAGAPYFLSLFYQRRELGKRVAILLGMAPLANCFASALAYGITHITGTIEPWRLLFLIGMKRSPFLSSS
jgi:MFS family permease